MPNFLQFIEEDVQSKKTLLSAMPTSTKTNKRKYNEKIASFQEKYEEYRVAIKKYLDLKSKSFHINDTRNPNEINEKVASLENIKFILNPTNGYFEKMGFDTLLYQMSNYQDLKFSCLKDIINALLDKFDMAAARPKKENFDYTYYINEFMSSFLDIRHSGSNNYDQLTEIFEKIYWESPELIKHLELNFRKLIKKNEKKFIDYISKLQSDIKVRSGLSYESCLEKLLVTYRELNSLCKENISDVICLAKDGTIDINNYFEDSKIRSTTFSDLLIDPLNMSDEITLNKFYDNIEKLTSNVEEFANYVKFSPLIIDFKNRYLKQGTQDSVQSKGRSKNNSALKEIESKISKAEKKLSKLNKKVINYKFLNFNKKDNNQKDTKFESIKLANELSVLYDTYNEEYFKEVVLSKVSETFTVTDLLYLYYSFDFYKKTAIKRVYEVNNYDEIVKYSDSFDLFALNPTNVIVCAAALYNEENIARVIINKYRLLNINITEEDLNPEDLNTFLEKLKLIIRVREIENSSISVEKIWFIREVNKIDIANSAE
ncbi:MAG: hypothetical protein PHX04_05155 [Bacilli bacterium]|nr:hypothetical protein [Bacilli bacterium]